MVAMSSSPDRFFLTIVADNPQTFHQALLLMANLARLAPDSVLRNVMPVFTFMGSNVFHRDDTYSFRVVQQVTHPVLTYPIADLIMSFADH
jgi:U3 small nucleolar RNA-associated protein 10